MPFARVEISVNSEGSRDLSEEDVLLRRDLDVIENRRRGCGTNGLDRGRRMREVPRDLSILFCFRLQRRR